MSRHGKNFLECSSHSGTTIHGISVFLSKFSSGREMVDIDIVVLCSNYTTLHDVC
jgi:hypothetical protein